MLIGEVASLDEAIERANASDYGLTAGFYGGQHEIAGFLDRIEAGVTYVNRPQGATTGAWPGYQPFGGRKGSGSTGKNSGGLYYLPLYMQDGLAGLQAGCWYCQQLQTWEQPDFRQLGMDWLSDTNHVCVHYGGPGGPGGGTRRGH